MINIYLFFFNFNFFYKFFFFFFYSIEKKIILFGIRILVVISSTSMNNHYINDYGNGTQYKNKT